MKKNAVVETKEGKGWWPIILGVSILFGMFTWGTIERFKVKEYEERDQLAEERARRTIFESDHEITKVEKINAALRFIDSTQHPEKYERMWIWLYRLRQQ